MPRPSAPDDSASVVVSPMPKDGLAGTGLSAGAGAGPRARPMPKASVSVSVSDVSLAPKDAMVVSSRKSKLYAAHFA